jgi:two-component system osmolarity sensor histidine kinase EnvZ
MLKSLHARNIALLVTVVLVGQIMSVALVWALTIRPQAERVGGIMARNIAAISQTMDRLPPDRRHALIAEINRGGAIRILPGHSAPPEDRGIPTMLERIFIESFAREMASEDVIIWRGGLAGQLWVRVTLGGERWWISYERPAGWSPNGALLASFAITVSLALIGGILLQRRIAHPLRAFADAADALRTDAAGPALPTDGPREIATVARSFNQMRTRLVEQERERALMLAGISHDLRTPLSKIRLITAMIPDIDPETDAMLVRQYEHMDQMLAQFLDFARHSAEEAPRRIVLAPMIADIAVALAVDVTINGEHDLAVVAPEMMLRRALTNLVRNAQVHGLPPIVAELCETSHFVRIAIKDHGDGIAPDKIEQVARPFVRGEEARPSDGGTGLGLAIVQQATVAMGGKLELSNQSDGGFVATLSLPTP